MQYHLIAFVLILGAFSSKAQQPEYLRFKITTESRSDECVIRLHEQASSEYDSKWDAYNLTSTTSKTFDIFTKNDDGTQYSINSMNMNRGMTETTLVIRSPKNQPILLDITNSKSLTSAWCTQLKCVELGIQTSIRNDTILSITSTNDSLIFNVSFYGNKLPSLTGLSCINTKETLPIFENDDQRTDHWHLKCSCGATDITQSTLVVDHADTFTLSLNETMGCSVDHHFDHQFTVHPTPHQDPLIEAIDCGIATKKWRPS